MKKNLIVFLAVFAAMLCLPSIANSTVPIENTKLTVNEAKQEIEVYEFMYWNNIHLQITVSQCHRYNANRISCLAVWKGKEYIAFDRDYVTLHRNGEVIVNPAGLEIILLIGEGQKELEFRL